MDPNDPLGLGFPDEDDWVHSGPVAENGSATEPVESSEDEQPNISYFFEQAIGIQDPHDVRGIRRHTKRPLRSYNRHKWKLDYTVGEHSACIWRQRR
ncbi:uncharacterized protein B0T23DRAFT_312813 [Neurospora hispaniola]|uniref:Uncharacterized protein n=1 Tax=Neurospora hispaniola TaxID=588809 RepID=A0AAJ0MTD3_9PEZI|nr:hypothetical protein B0T23DRAFT_312813 [Neurospora hispaniola]